MRQIFASAAAAMVVSLLPTAAPRAQEPEKPAEPLVFDLKIICEAWGEPRPRDAERQEAAFFLVGHKLRWEVGPRRFRTPAKLRAELERIRATAGKDAAQGWAVRIRPGKNVCLSDVVLTLDQVREVGFDKVRFDRVRLDLDLRRVPAADAAPDLIPPASKKTADEKTPAWSPEMKIHQDGRIELEGDVVYDPDKEQSVDEASRTLLFKLRQEARGRGLVRFDRTDEPPREVVDEPLLIRADKWTEWHYVGKFLEKCSAADATFSRVRLGVTEVDLEVEHLRR